MPYFIIFFVISFALGCSSVRPQSKAAAPADSLSAGNYELRGNAASAAAGMPTLQLELGNDGMLRVTEAGVLHVRTQLIQRAGGELEFRDQEGPRACRNPEPILGRYRAERTAQGWRLHVISDACEGRKGALDGGMIGMGM